MSDEDKSVVEVARERFKAAESYMSKSRMLSIDDTKFAMADSDNMWQWPTEISQNRANTRNVCLTVNMTAQHCNQIINSIRQNSPQIRVLPADNYADKKSAEIMAGLIRNIQNNSNADDAHITAAECAVYGGEGFWRIVTEYESDKSFNQVIKIKTIQNPNLVYIDPAAKEHDKSDAEWGFVFDDISKAACKRMAPDIDPETWAMDQAGWVRDDTVRIAEYFYCEYVPDKLLLLQDGSEEGVSVYLSEIPADKHKAIKSITVNERDTFRRQWKWCKLIGGHDKPVEEKDWPGSYLPIVSIVGKEMVVNGEVTIKGLVRDLKDAARMVNYSYSAAIETVALQNKVPYVASAEAIDGYENEWNTANVANYSTLRFNAYDDAGNPLPRPERQQPAVMPTAQVALLQLSTEQMRAASGQQNANFGIRSEASSGIGIQRLKAQGETATFHFPDNQVRGLRYEGVVLIDLIPKIYDTKRIIRILGLDGKDEMAVLDPNAQEAYQEHTVEEEVKKIFNPLLGSYDVVIDTGPSFQTQRQEAAAILSDLAQHNPQIMQVAGDIVMRSYDFPMADQLASRLEKTLPPGLVDEKPGVEKEIPPEVKQAMDQLQQHTQMLEESLKEIGDKYNELHDSNQIDQAKLLLDRYGKETERLKLIYPTMPEAIANTIATEFGVEIINEQGGIPDGEMMVETESPEHEQQEEGVKVKRMAIQSQSGDVYQGAIEQDPSTPKVKRLSIVAPSGAVYHGEIIEETIPVQQPEMPEQYEEEQPEMEQPETGELE